MSLENKVEKAIKTFYSSMKENVDYVDLNFRGIVSKVSTFKDDAGNKKNYIEQTVGVSGIECLRDKFRIWLMSDSGDFHRNPENGGFLAKNVVKRPFIDSNCPVIEALLKAEAEDRFPQLQIMDVKVTCDHTTRRWIIKVSILDKKTGIIDDTMYLDGEAVYVFSN